MRMDSRAAYAIGAAALAFALIFLIVQDRRHGWPFSRHHGLQAVAEQAALHANAAAAPASARALVQLPAEQIDTLGVQFEPVEMRTVREPVHAVATIVADESRITHVHTRVSGWLEELYVNTTGEHVRAGQPVAAVFSQELYSSQQEYLSALQRAGSGPASAVLDAARTRLQVLGMDRADIERLEKTRQARRLVTIPASRSGVVLNRGVSAGTAIDPSTEILTLADLSVVWVIAEVPEPDAAQLKPGSTAALSFPTSGREAFAARVEFIYPTLSERTRSVRVRLPVPNEDGRLRPGMYGSAEFPTVAREALTVSRDAVVDTGQAQHVFVHTAEDVLEPREVKVGARLADRVEIIEGLIPGEHVVASGVFLIDSESRLRASGGAGHAGHGGEPARATERANDAPDGSAQHEH